VNADSEVQLSLLDLQALDSALDRLAHRRRNLPELARIDELDAQLSGIDGELVNVETDDRDLGRQQLKIEADIDQVRTRVTRDQARLDNGQVSSPKELENLQSELASLGRRQSDLEDQVLDVMERREAVQARLGEIRLARDGVVAEQTAAEERRDATLAEIDHEAGQASQRRKELAGGLPAELTALYEKIRASAGGVGAAALHRGRCEGCHLQLNTVELNALRAAAPEAVLRCEECRRILVRTADSGL